MNTSHVNYGQTYRLIRAALQLRSFTVSELQGLTGAVTDTIYSFLARLSSINSGFLQSNSLESSGRGRPRKRYQLTEAGTHYLLNWSAQIMAPFMSQARKPATATEATADSPVHEFNMPNSLFPLHELGPSPKNGIQGEDFSALDTFPFWKNK